MSRCTSPPGGVKPGASRWSAAVAAGGAAPCMRTSARTIAATIARSATSPSVRLSASFAVIRTPPFVSPDHWPAGASCSAGRGVRFEPSGRRGRTRCNRREGWRNGLGRGKVVLGVVSAGVAAVVFLLGGILSRSPVVDPLADARAQAGSADRASLSRLLTGFAAGDTAGLVRRLEQRVADEPGDGDALAVLGLAYQQRARETGTPAFYGLSARAFRRAAAAQGPLPVIVVGRASLANARHRFADGLRLARQAIRLDSEDGAAYGALGDALLNLGRYESAFAAYDRMAKLSPGIPSYARVAHARELLGRTSAAVEAYELALETGSSVPEYVAWVLVH